MCDLKLPFCFWLHCDKKKKRMKKSTFMYKFQCFCNIWEVMFIFFWKLHASSFCCHGNQRTNMGKDLFSIFYKIYCHAIFKKDNQKQKNPLHYINWYLFNLSMSCKYLCVLQTIDLVMKIENEFFPVIAGDLGSSVETANRYQNQLEEFSPMFKVCLFLYL